MLFLKHVVLKHVLSLKTLKTNAKDNNSDSAHCLLAISIYYKCALRNIM